ncbi:MAG TPA: DUF2891 domain-containing protein [Sphingomicrobium sp.]|nr:DUF2891 domain-containing protein [Sphingomicrobium sp.]
MKLDQTAASNFAGIVLGHVRKPYPYKMDHVLNSDEDARPPRHFHPIFYGSFDWHSCVHGWWSLLTLRRLYREIAEAERIAVLADDSFTGEKVEGERAYLERPNSRGFERPYGWGWLLYLHLEASRHGDHPWATELEPLARALADRFRAYLPILTYPIRVGTHFNTSFGLLLALDWAKEFDSDLAGVIRAWASDRYGMDRDCQAWEPGGDEFLSSALTEAHLMARVLEENAFRSWFAAFLPRLCERRPASLFTPATVSDRSDGKIAHLDGLNLSRAWCWRQIAARLEEADAAVARAAADEHLAAGLPHLASDYAGEHWLTSFALLALLAE